MSRRVVVAGTVTGSRAGVKGKLAATDAVIDALLEARRQPRGHYLRLYRDGTWPERPAKGEAP